MRWIGREVKRFCNEAHIHLPFLLRVAQSAPDMDGVDMPTNDAGELELEEDDELFIDDDDREQAAEEVTNELELHASYWDHFLALVRWTQEPWADEDDDTDEYREGRAVEAFNLGNAVACDIVALNPDIQGWVLHVMCFIVPRQIVPLGNPSRRSCDACESLGAVVKKTIRHLTCRRMVTRGEGGVRKGGKGGSHNLRFTRGYIEQVFRRMTVRSELIHGAANIPYLLRGDYRLLGKGKVARKKLRPDDVSTLPSVEASVAAPTVWSEKMHLAVWS